MTREDAQKVLALVDQGLGIAIRPPEPLCVEAVIALVLDGPKMVSVDGQYSDNPSCVAQAVRLLGIRLNDSNWSAPEARAKGLRRFAIAQLGSRGTVDEREFDVRTMEIGRSYVGVAESYALLKPEADSKFAAQSARHYADDERPDRIQGAQYTVRAAAAAAGYYGGEQYSDRVFSQYAEQIVGVLRDLGSPGCQWLGLTE